MKKWILGLAIGVLVLGGGLFLSMLKGPDLKKYDVLKEPRISQKADLAVLEVPFEVPQAELMKVFGILMKTYFGLPGVPKGPGMPAPAARYTHIPGMPLPGEMPAAAAAGGPWKGAAGIAVPSSLKALPAVQANPAPRLAVWSYGEVAEILHLGSYDTETGDIRKLTDFIAAQGYEITGAHEEEYLRGPGMPFVSPKDYVTIIRYPVKKKAPAVQP